MTELGNTYKGCEMVEDKPRKLSKRKLAAIIEALTERLAGEVETSIPIKDYKEALLWAQQKIQKGNSS